jgi:hypothetical protein
MEVRLALDKGIGYSTSRKLGLTYAYKTQRIKTSNRDTYRIGMILLPILSTGDHAENIFKARQDRLRYADSRLSASGSGMLSLLGHSRVLFIGDWRYGKYLDLLRF